MKVQRSTDKERDAYRLALERLAYGKVNASGSIKPHPGTEAQEMARQVLVAHGVATWSPEGKAQPSGHVGNPPLGRKLRADDNP
jgi:hypothetical protein